MDIHHLRIVVRFGRHDWKTLLCLRAVSKDFLQIVSTEPLEVDLSSLFLLHDVSSDLFFWQDELSKRAETRAQNSREEFSRFCQIFNLLRHISVLHFRDIVIGRHSFLVLAAAFVFGQLGYVGDDPSRLPSTSFSFPDSEEALSYKSQRNLGHGVKKIFFWNVVFGEEGCACCDAKGNLESFFSCSLLRLGISF